MPKNPNDLSADNGGHESDSDDSGEETITEEEYNRAMGEVGQERDYQGYKQYLRDRRRYQRMYENELRNVEEEKEEAEADPEDKDEDLERGGQNRPDGSGLNNNNNSNLVEGEMEFAENGAD